MKKEYQYLFKMGYLSDLTTTLLGQLNTAMTNRERTTIVAQLATVQRASGSQATALPAHNHSVSLGGSGTAYIPASVGGNMFIYLGL
jgi:hypothetical protein